MRAIYYNIFGIGHIRPTLPLISELTRRGVDILYHSSPSRKALIETTGAVFKNYGRDDYSANDYNPNKNFVLQNLPAAKGLLSFLQQEIEEYRPDFILYDSMAPWGYIIAKIYNIPAFCLVTTLALTLDEINEAFAYNQIAIDEKNQDEKNQEVIAFFKQNFNLEISLHMALGAYGKNNIVFTSESLNTPLNYPNKDFYFTGPQIQKLAELEKKYLKDKNQKLIVMSFGTIVLHERPTLITHFIKFIHEFENEPDTKIVLAVGNANNVQLIHEHFPQLPKHILVEEFIPQQSLLNIADVFINHGGMNSINEALYFGIPQIIIPIANDHFNNANQVEKRFFGVQVPKNGYWSFKTLIKEAESCFRGQKPKVKGSEEIVQYIMDRI